MKTKTRLAIGTFIVMATKLINGMLFHSWRTPDNKHFYLTPHGININNPGFGVNPDNFEVTYTVLGHLDMIK